MIYTGVGRALQITVGVLYVMVGSVRDTVWGSHICKYERVVFTHPLEHPEGS